MKTWELQNSQLLNCSVNWKNLEVHSRLIFQNPNFQYFPWIGKKLRVPARATFKNPNVQSLCELGKTWEYHLSPTFKSTNFESIDELRRKGIDKKFPYLRSTAGNKIRNLHKAGHISTLIWWMRYSISSNFKNLSMNWVKYVFHLEKWNFAPNRNFVYTTGFLTLRKYLLIILPLYLQQILLPLYSLYLQLKQITISMGKMLQLKRHSLKKMIWSLETLTLTFYAKWIYFKCQPFGVQRSIRLFWNNQKWRNKIMIIYFKFLRNKNCLHKIGSRHSSL